MPRWVHPMLAAVPASWLGERGALPEGFDPACLTQEGVSTETQRGLLLRVAEVGGEAAVVGLGERLLQAREQPLIYVMLNSRTIVDFIDKEQRFNRFFHTDHRVCVHEVRDDLLELEHVGHTARPHRIESLFVLGLHITVLLELGCQHLQVRLPESTAPQQELLGGGRVESIPEGAAHLWRFSWRHFVTRRLPFAGLDELLLKQAEPADLSAPRSVEESLLRLVEGDLAKRWSIGETARSIGKSARTLQRELSARGTSFTQLVEQARIAAAAKLLRDPFRSITEIGYVCGFADAAHFSRRFKACTSQTPSEFRLRPAAE